MTPPPRPTTRPLKIGYAYTTLTGVASVLTAWRWHQHRELLWGIIALVNLAACLLIGVSTWVLHRAIREADQAQAKVDQHLRRWHGNGHR